MMLLAFRHNDFYKKRVVEVDCSVMCSSTHSFSKRACAHIFVHLFIFWACQLMPRMHLSLRLVVQPLNIHSAEIQQPCAFYEEAKVSY
jgi:hypothetical protein